MRSTLLRILATALLALGVAVVAPAPLACACSCIGLTTPEALAAADAVFEGDVVATGTPKGGFSAELVPYTIAVSRVFKGDVRARVVVRSEASGASCGVELKGHVVVFASGRSDELRTQVCWMPETLDRTRLGTGTAPAEGTRTAPAGDLPPSPASTPADSYPVGALPGPLVLWTLAGVAAVAALVTWLVRRR